MAVREAAEYSGYWRSVHYTEFTLSQLAANGMSVGVVSDQMKAELQDIGKTMTEEWLQEAGSGGQAIVDAYRSR